MYEILRLLKKEKTQKENQVFELSKLSCIFSHMTTQWAYGLLILRKLRFEKTHQCLRVVEVISHFSPCGIEDGTWFFENLRLPRLEKTSKFEQVFELLKRMPGSLTT